MIKSKNRIIDSERSNLRAMPMIMSRQLPYIYLEGLAGVGMETDQPSIFEKEP